MDELLNDIHVRLLPSGWECSQRKSLVARIDSIARSLPGCDGVDPFGSFAMSLFSDDSDLDLSLNTSSRSSGYFDYLKVLRARIKRTALFRDLEYVRFARVPILKFTEIHSGIACDVSVDNKSGVKMSSMLKELLDVEPLSYKLCYLVKRWAKHFNINSSRDGTLGSIAWTMMVASFLQNLTPPLLPALSSMTMRGQNETPPPSIFFLFQQFISQTKLHLEDGRRLRVASGRSDRYLAGRLVIESILDNSNIARNFSAHGRTDVLHALNRTLAILEKANLLKMKQDLFGL